MEDAFYFGQGRLVSYNKFQEDENGTEKKKGVLYRMLCGVSNFQMYNKSVLRYKATTTDSL
jgi:hypothetical protein